MRSNASRFSHSHDFKVRGFTLIELLVVVSIIALLIAILIPSLSKARDQAKLTTCGANLHSIGQLLVMYTNVFGSLPFGDYQVNATGGTGGTADPTKSTHWYSVVQNMADSSAGTTWNDAGASNAAASKIVRMFVCPQVGDNGMLNPQNRGAQPLILCHYGVHPTLMPDINEWGQFLGNPSVQPYKYERIPKQNLALAFDQPLQVLTIAGIGTAMVPAFKGVAVANFIDNGAIFNGQLLTTTKPLQSSVDMTPFNSSTKYTNADNLFATENDNIYNIRFRHMGDTKANVLMVDGHVEPFTLSAGPAANSPNKTNFLRQYLYVNP